MDALSSEVFYRPSMSPGVSQCASFMWRPEGLDIQEEAGERADLGTALHELFYTHVYNRRVIDTYTLAHLADKHSVDVDGFEGITWRARKMEKEWAVLQEYYLNAHAREKKIGYTLPNGRPNEGTPDLWTVNGEDEERYACVLDLKTGMSDQDHRKQLLDYCLIIYKVHGIKEFYASVFNPVQDYYETWHFVEADVLGWEKELLRKMTVVAKEFRTGPACTHCPNLIRCPAHLNAVRPYYTPNRDGGPLIVQKITPEMIRTVRPLMQHFAKVVDAYKAIERGILEQFGTIDLGEGQELALATRYRKVYDVPKSMPVFEKMGIGQARVLQSLRLTSEAVEELAATVAKPREKGKTVQLAKDLLKGADAFHEKAEFYTQARRRQLPPVEVDNG